MEEDLGWMCWTNWASCDQTLTRVYLREFVKKAQWLVCVSRWCHCSGRPEINWKSNFGCWKRAYIKHMGSMKEYICYTLRTKSEWHSPSWPWLKKCSMFSRLKLSLLSVSLQNTLSQNDTSNKKNFDYCPMLTFLAESIAPTLSTCDSIHELNPRLYKVQNLIDKMNICTYFPNNKQILSRLIIRHFFI